MADDFQSYGFKTYGAYMGQNSGSKATNTYFSDHADTPSAVKNALGFAESIVKTFDKNNDRALDDAELQAMGISGKMSTLNLADTESERQSKTQVLDATELAAILLLKDLKNRNQPIMGTAQLSGGFDGSLETAMTQVDKGELMDTYAQFDLAKSYQKFLDEDLSLFPKSPYPMTSQVNSAAQQAQTKAQQADASGYPQDNLAPPSNGNYRITRPDGSTAEISAADFEALVMGGQRRTETVIVDPATSRQEMETIADQAVSQHEQIYHETPVYQERVYQEPVYRARPHYDTRRPEEYYYPAEEPYYADPNQQTYLEDLQYRDLYLQEAEARRRAEAQNKRGTGIQEVVPWVVLGLGAMTAINRMDRENEYYDRGFRRDPWNTWGGSGYYDPYYAGDFNLGFNQGYADPYGYNDVYGSFGSGAGNWGLGSLLTGNLGFNQGSYDDYGNYSNVYGNILL